MYHSWQHVLNLCNGNSKQPALNLRSKHTSCSYQIFLANVAANVGKACTSVTVKVCEFNFGTQSYYTICISTTLVLCPGGPLSYVQVGLIWCPGGPLSCVQVGPWFMSRWALVLSLGGTLSYVQVGLIWCPGGPLSCVQVGLIWCPGGPLSYVHCPGGPLSYVHCPGGPHLMSRWALVLCPIMSYVSAQSLKQSLRSLVNGRLDAVLDTQPTVSNTEVLVTHTKSCVLSPTTACHY